MKLRLATPSLLIDIGRLSDLSYVREDGDHVVIGALTRHRDLEISDVLRRQVPVLAHVAGQVGDPQVRHRGHHRRLGRPRRPGLGSAGRLPGPGCHLHAGGEPRASAASPPPTSSAASWRRPSSPTRS